jgi:hypothetical protein
MTATATSHYHYTRGYEAGYEEGYEDGQSENTPDSSEEETPIATAVLGREVTGAVRSYEIRTWAEAQQERHFRYWLLDIADAVERLEDRTQRERERQQEENRRREQAMADKLAREAAGREGWPG